MKRLFKLKKFQEKSRSLDPSARHLAPKFDILDDSSLEFLMYGKSAQKLPDCYRSQVCPYHKFACSTSHSK